MDTELNYRTENLEKWDQLTNFQWDRWLFRGQADYEWKLKTPLERACKRLYGTLDEAYQRETQIIRECQRSFHHYVSDCPPLDDELEWLSLMRHHGAPTRLLDWSYSIYIAAYFALINAKVNAAIWMIDTPWFRKRSTEILQDAGVEGQYLVEPVSVNLPQRFELIYLNKSLGRIVRAVNPFRKNVRLNIQQGLFLTCGDLSVPFEENIAAMQGYEDHLVKLNISTRIIGRDAFIDLHRMNITHATLFPGLDGFCTSLAHYNPTVWSHLGIVDNSGIRK